MDNKYEPVLSKQEYNKKYYERNREKILEQVKKIVVCDRCNKQIPYGKLARHQKTNRCQLIHKNNQQEQLLTQNKESEQFNEKMKLLKDSTMFLLMKMANDEQLIDKSKIKSFMKQIERKF